MAKTKKAEKKRFYTEAELEADPTIDAQAKVGGEFIHKREEGEYTGQTVEVKSDTHLEKDLGTGQELIIRTYQFATNPQTFNDYLRMNGHGPFIQEIFESHKKGIAAMLWQDGLVPAEEFPVRVIFSEDKSKYLIMVGARASIGQTFMDKPKTLTEILKPSETGNNKHKVPGVL